MQIAGAIYHSPVHNMCGCGLAAEFSTPNGGRVEVAAAPLSYGCCKSLLDGTVDPVSVGL